MLIEAEVKILAKRPRPVSQGWGQDQTLSAEAKIVTSRPVWSWDHSACVFFTCVYVEWQGAYVGVFMCLLTSYCRCFFHIPLSTLKPQTVDAASVTPQDSDRQVDISFDTKVCSHILFSQRAAMLPCSASTVRASEKSSVIANRKSYMSFPTSHPSRFYTAPNFLKMGSNT